MISYELRHLIEIIVGDDEDEECDDCEKEEEPEKATRMKLYGPGEKKFWMPRST